MIFQTAMSSEFAEVAFRSVRSSITATDTSATLRAGEPVLMATHTASANGVFVQRALSQTNPINNLYVGNIHDTIAHEGMGLAQCYGIDTDVRLIEMMSASAGQLLVPELGATVTQLSVQGRSGFVTQESPQFAAVATGAVTVQYKAHGAAGLAVVLVAATALTATAGPSTCTAFIRAL